MPKHTSLQAKRATTQSTATSKSQAVVHPHASPSPITDPRTLTPTQVLQLQRTHGNRAVGRLLHTSQSPTPTLKTTQPIQRVFTYTGAEEVPQQVQIGQQPPPKMFNWKWVDSDTNEEYRWRPNSGLATGPLIEGTQIPTFMNVMRLDGYIVVIRPTEKEGKVWVVEHEEQHEREIRLKPGSYVPQITPPPKMVPSNNFDIEVMEDEPQKSTFTQGTFGEKRPEQQSEEQLELKGLRNMRLAHDLTTQMQVIPLQQGVPIRLPSDNNNQLGEIVDYAYSATSVGVASVLIGDKDRTRVGTYLEPNEGSSTTPQGKHTVAWALARRSIVGLAGRKVSDVLNHFIAAFALLRPMTKESPEAEFHWNRIKYPESLNQLATATLKIDRWQAILSELVAIYTQLYHLSRGALFKGNSKQRGESPSVNTLAKNEESLARGNKLTDSKSKLRTAAQKLLEIHTGLPLQTYAFAMHHWVEALVLTYPQVMKAHGKYITDPFLNTSLQGKEVPIGVTTARELIAFYKYELPSFAKTVIPISMKGETTFTPFAIKKLKADFVANAEVTPNSAGQAKQYQVQEGSVKRNLQIRAYTLNDLVLNSLSISDNDRPPTKFGSKGQKSHTVAWTLVRNDLLAYGQGPLSNLLTFLKNSFVHLKKDSALPEGKQLAQHGIDQMQNVDTQQWALHDWQHYVSMLVKWYAHVYQQAQSTSFVDISNFGRAMPHAEGIHMAVLHRNEVTLFDERKLLDSPQRVVEAAIAIFDMELPKAINQTKTEKNQLRAKELSFMIAYDHWKERITHTFPEIIKVGWSDIYDGLAKVDVGWQNHENVDTRYGGLHEMGMGVTNSLGDILKRNNRNK